MAISVDSLTTSTFDLPASELGHTPTAADPAGVAAAPPAGTLGPSVSWRRTWRAFSELGKARLNALVVVTTAVGFLVANVTAWEWPLLAFTIIGTALAAAGSGAFNCLLEIDRDRAMKRTKKRPLPAGELSRSTALAFALICSIGGIAVLAHFVNPLTAGLAALVVVLYAAVYTPMKTVSPSATLVGGVCGAIPPMMGVTAATGELTPAAWALGAILFVWQIPHFLALAWMYRDDYARGGFRMLPAIDPTGILTARQALIYTVALIPLGLLASLAGIGGYVFCVGSAVLGSLLARPAWRFYRERSALRARRLFLSTLAYLPMLMALMVIDRGPLVPANAPADFPTPPMPVWNTEQTAPPAVVANFATVTETLPLLPRNRIRQ